MDLAEIVSFLKVGSFLNPLYLPSAIRIVANLLDIETMYQAIIGEFD